MKALARASFRLSVLSAILAGLPAARAAIVERRIWIETAIDTIKEDQCQDSQKKWRCLFPLREDCIREMKAVFVPCGNYVVPDLPEYIDGPERKAEATRIVVDCMTTELTKKFIINLGKEKLDEYNLCTGAVARSKPLSPSWQKALDFSRTQTAHSCAGGSFLRKCWSIPESFCRETVEKAQADCTMKMESDGTPIKKEEASIQEAGRKVTDCALADARKALDASRKRIKDKDCE